MGVKPVEYKTEIAKEVDLGEQANKKKQDLFQIQENKKQGKGRIVKEGRKEQKWSKKQVQKDLSQKNKFEVLQDQDEEHTYEHELGEKIQNNEKVNKEENDQHTPLESKDKLESSGITSQGSVTDYKLETTTQEEEMEGKSVSSKEQMLEFDDSKGEDEGLQ
ncbi:hypothetical protein HAX54_017325, partial [Datura stramonium]|nr:hypothetical protein [Datura stramonium]